jgi:hypothetical protein
MTPEKKQITIEVNELIFEHLMQMGEKIDENYKDQIEPALFINLLMLQIIKMCATSFSSKEDGIKFAEKCFKMNLKFVREEK